MEKILITLSIIISTILIGRGQDYVITQAGKELQVKVEEVLPTEIKYRMYNNLEGPLYTVEKSSLLMIRYQNGEIEIIKNAATTQQQPVQRQPETTVVVERVVEQEDNTATEILKAGVGIAVGAAALHAISRPLYFPRPRPVPVVVPAPPAPPVPVHHHHYHKNGIRRY